MPITLEWVTDDILMWYVTGHYDFETVLEYNRIGSSGVAERAPTQVYVLVDLRYSDPPPRQMVFANLRYITRSGPSNWLFTIFVTESILVTRLIDIFNQINPRPDPKFLTAPSLNSAYQLIEHHRQRASNG